MRLFRIYLKEWSLMTQNRKAQIKNLQQLRSNLAGRTSRYLNGTGQVLDALLQSPGVDSSQIFQTMSDEAQKKVDLLLIKLENLLLDVDPLATLGQLVVSDSLRRNFQSASDSFGSDAVVEFLAGFITSLDPEMVMGRIGTEFNPPKFQEIEDNLQEFANLHNAIRFRTPRTDSKDDIGLAQILLTLEAQFDRTDGYPPHLKEICKRIFEPLSEMSLKVYGFRPSIVFDLQEAELIYQEGHFRRAFEAIGSELMESPQFNNLTSEKKSAIAFFQLLYSATVPIEENLIDRLCVSTGHSRREVTAAVHALSTDLGAQPPIRNLGDTILIQTKPIIRLPDGTSFWYRPVDFPHEALNWFHELTAANEKMRESLNSARQKVVPRLVSEKLGRIFGESRTYLEPTYEAVDGSKPDLDVLVLLPKSAIFAEVKAGRFTPAGRAGLTDRVTTKVKELFLEPYSQVSRAVDSSDKFPDSWRQKDQKKKKIELGSPTQVIKMIVTLENMDAISTWGQLKNQGNKFYPLEVWPISLSNLMMVADILTNPHEFFAYATDRMMMFTRGQPLIYMESDILSHWCIDRISNFSLHPAESQVLSYGSDDINEYFTLGARIEKPSSRVPEVVNQALDYILEHEPIVWLEAVEKVYGATDSDWFQARKSLCTIEEMPIANRRRGKRRRKLIDGVRVGDSFELIIRPLDISKRFVEAKNLPTLCIVLDKNTVLEAAWRSG